VPVPDRPTREGLVRMKQRTAEAMAKGIDLVVYPEGTRTRTGRVGPFRPGLFRMAVEMGRPIVPVSVVGAYALKRVGRARLGPARIVVHLHPAVEPGDDPAALRERVRRTVVGPLEAAGEGREAG
jgi:1-acyl-sn-glycerol-3-phosphate acyltransferase